MLLQAPEVQAVVIQQCHQLALQNPYNMLFFQNHCIKYNIVNLAITLVLFAIFVKTGLGSHPQFFYSSEYLLQHCCQLTLRD